MDLCTDSFNTAGPFSAAAPTRRALFDAKDDLACRHEVGTGSTPAGRAAELWQGLASGRLKVVGHGTDDTHAVLLLRAARQRAVEGHPHHCPATLELALGGRAQKVLAFDSQVVPSVVSQRLAHTLRNFGLDCSPRFAPMALVLLAAAYRDVGTLTALQLEQRELADGTLLLRMLRPDPILRPRVSHTEYDVLRRIIDGCSNSRVSEMRKRSARTVANQLRSISSKLGVSGRLQYINLAVKLAAAGHGTDPH
jgi:DNA-binding CsgD family transcriptional regulator